jgi:two-component system, response regulator PdtaR
MNVVPPLSPVPADVPVPAVLVVEDDVLVRTIAAAYLRDSDLEVIEAGSADEAIRLLKTGLKVGVVFSDVNMPGSMDGFGLASWLCEYHPEIKIILTTGALRTAKQVDEALVRGPVLAKPYHHEELTLRIRGMLGR